MTLSLCVPSIDRQRQCRHLMELTFAFCRSQCLFAAIELGIFPLLEKESLDSTEISARLQLNERGARDLLDALVGLDLLIRHGDRYQNGPVASAFLVPDTPSYIGGWCSFTSGRLYPVWRSLAEAIRTGLPQNEAKTEADYYSNLGSDAERLDRFMKAMTGLSVRPAEVIASIFPWASVRTFIDLGGATGSLAAHLLRTHPHLTGGVFELPSVRPFCDATATEFAGRLTCHEGDFFTTPLPQADVYILGHVLHNWNADEKDRLLRAVHHALKPGGSIVVYEWFLDDTRERLLALLDSLTMRLVTRTGGSITQRECESELSRAGFGQTEAIDDEPYTIVVGRKTT